MRLRRITLGSADKFFSKEGGRSHGSEEILEFEVEEDIEPAQIGRMILEKRREMDERVLCSEFLRGGLDAAQLEHRRSVLRARYAAALKPKEKDDAGEA